MCEQNVELLNFNTANGILLDVVHSLHEGVFTVRMSSGFSLHE
jgi:hypothetical protein